MAGEDAIFLTREYKNILDDMIRDYRSRAKGRSYHRPRDEEDDTGTYLARVPDVGIPALSSNTTGTGTGTTVNDDVPGYADCEIYKVLHNSDDPSDVNIVPAGFVRTVYNFDINSVDGDSWIVVNQDNFGTWLVKDKSLVNVNCVTTRTRITNVCANWSTQTLTIEREIYDVCTDEVLLKYCVTNPTDCCAGVESSCCPGVLLANKFCITFGGILAGLGSIELTYRELSNAWDGSGSSLALTCCSTSSNPTFPTYVRIYCNGALFYMDIICGGGTGNYLFRGEVSSRPLSFSCLTSTGSGTETVLTGTGVCADNSFTYSIVPGECTTTGTGSGTGTSGGKISTTCCVVGLDQTLSVSLFGNDTCSCVTGTYPIVWDGSRWYYNASHAACGDGAYLSIVLTCNASNQWQLLVSAYKPLGATTSWTLVTTATCTLPIPFGSAIPSPQSLCNGTLSATVSI